MEEIDVREVERYASEKGTRVTIYLTPELAEQVRQLARHYNISYSGMIRKMVIYWIARHTRKESK